MQGRRVWLALALGVLGREALADDASSEAAASAPRAAELRRVSERPSRVPTGAVKLAPRPSPRPAGAASGVVRVPLSSQLDATSTLAPGADSFGIAAGAGRIDTSSASAPVLELPANRSAIITSRSGKAAGEREELSVEQKTALPWLVVESAASASSILGFGFESVVLTATQVEEDGSLLASDEDRVYHLTFSSGDHDAAELIIQKGTSDASVELRPDGIADLEIVASFGALRSEPVRVALSWPLVPLSAMLSGAPSPTDPAT